MFVVRVWPSRPCHCKRRVAGFGLFACGLIVLFLCRPSCHAAERLLPCSMPDTGPPVAELEGNLLSILNRDRAQRGLPRLLADSSLARIARDHSRNMAAQGILSHDLPPSGDLKMRLSRAGYLVRKARENVARANSIEQAESALLKSPGHLRNILAQDVTHVGVGIARGSASDGSDLYITQVFADPAIPPQPALLRKTHLARIEEVRRNSGSKPLRVDPLFDKVAARLLENLKFPFKTEDIERLLDRATEQIPRGTVKDVSRMSLDIQLIRDIKDLKACDELRRARASVVGAASREFLDSRGQPVVAILTLIGSR